MAIHIYTKKLRSKWYCYGTVEGYDHSYDGDTQDEAEMQMIAVLEKRGLIDQAVFNDPEIIEEQPKHEKSDWRPPFIDFDPLG
jgi:hypothetical protein